MREVTLFCEDSFHEKFVGALLRRFEREQQVKVGLRPLSARGGLPRMKAEFVNFLRDLNRDRRSPPDAVIVVADANCLGHNGRRRVLDGALVTYPHFRQLVSYAIPDPHIERWMLADAHAFQAVFGRGCTIPAIKCKKDEYKRILRKEIQDSGIDAPLGGEEYAEDIVQEMDLSRVETNEPSLGLFLRNLKGLFNGWKHP